MGNHRFRLSDMIPNSWFYKLKDMGRTRNQNNNINHPRNKKQPLKPSSSSSSSPSTSPPSISIPPQQFQSQTELSHQRKSYYFTRELTPPPPQPPITSHESSKIIETHLPDPPRKSSKQRLSTTRRRNRASSRQPPSPLRHVAATVSTGCSCRANIDSVWAKPDSTSEEYPISPLGSSSDLQSLFPEFGSDNDSDVPKFDVFDAISQLHLPPILTKKTIQKDRKYPNGSLSVKVVEKEKNRFCKEQRKSPVRSPGVRIRANSPRIARIGAAHGRKSASSSRRSLSESFAVVKSSVDPQRDFRESMVEMILENNLKASKDLEDLLACYLQLNSDEYHEVIVEVFKQIWFDLAHVRFKN